MSAQPTPVSRRSIEGRFIVIVSVVVLAVTVVSYGVLYSLTIAGRVDGLQQMAQSQARLIESVGKFDAFFQSSATPGGYCWLPASSRKQPSDSSESISSISSPRSRQRAA